MTTPKRPALGKWRKNEMLFSVAGVPVKAACWKSIHDGTWNGYVVVERGAGWHETRMTLCNLCDLPTRASARRLVEAYIAERWGK